MVSPSATNYNPCRKAAHRNYSLFTIHYSLFAIHLRAADSHPYGGTGDAGPATGWAPPRKSEK